MRPYLRVANVFEDRIDTKSVMEMNFTPDEFERYKLRFGDILLNEGQSFELIGRPAMYRDEVPGACFTNTLVRFRSHEGVNQEFALRVFLAYLKNKRFQKIASITVNLAHLGAGRFAEIEFPLPPIKEQTEIVRIVDEKIATIDATEKWIQKCINRSASLKQSILKNAFEGKLCKQCDPNPSNTGTSKVHQSRKTRHPASEIMLRRSTIASYIVNCLHDQPAFGRTQLAKAIFLTQSYVGIDLEIDFVQMKAGPFHQVIYPMENLAKREEWFSWKEQTVPNNPKKIWYEPAEKMDDAHQQALEIIGDRKSELDRLLSFFTQFDTDQAELVATVFAVWNDLLISGSKVTKGVIINDFYGWHKSKRKFAETRIKECIRWIKMNRLDPKGAGRLTKKAEK